MPTPLDLYIVLDRSGSMHPVAGTVITEVNRLVASVGEADPEATVTLVAFDSHDPFEFLLNRQSMTGHAMLTAEDYQPGAGTPLFDAIASTLQLASRDQRLESRRRRVLIAIITDGEDNDSTTTAVEVLGKVQRRRAAGWKFLYLGVGDVFTDAARLGIDADAVHPWEPTRAGTAAAFATITTAALHQPVIRRRHRRA